MTCASIILKLKKFGITGAFTAFCRLFQRDTEMHETMLRSAMRQKTTPQHGITIIGDMTTHTSMSKVLCDIYLKLQECGIPCQCLDIKKPFPDEFKLLKYDNVLCMLLNPLPKQLRSRVKTSVIAFWEFDTGLLQAYPHLADGDATIAMSDFNFEYYSNVLPKKKVKKILYPLQLPKTPTLTPQSIRKKFKIPLDSFVVFYNFDLGTKRKNPEGILSAFAKAFPSDKNAVLLFKTMSSQRFPECLIALQNQALDLGIASRFITINNYLPDEEMTALTNACDVYISLHRGEGFGLGIAEAMHLSKPVVATNWSATNEFCNADNALLIPYEKQPLSGVDFNLYPYDGVKNWAEPDIEAAAIALRKLFDDPALRLRLGENGKHFIEEHFSIANFKKSIDTFLDND